MFIILTPLVLRSLSFKFFLHEFNYQKRTCFEMKLKGERKRMTLEAIDTHTQTQGNNNQAQNIHCVLF